MLADVKYGLKMKKGSNYEYLANVEDKAKNFAGAIDYICRAENCYLDAYSMACSNQNIDNSTSKRAVDRIRERKAQILKAFNESIM